MTIVASMCPVMESAGPTRPGDSDATMLRFDQYRDSGARVLNGFILEPELFRMPANSLQALFAAACDRTDFPTEIDQLLLSVAANHAATAFQNARLIYERKRAEAELRQARDELELRVGERTAELRRSEAYLAEAQRLTHTGSWAWNIATGETIHASEEDARLFGSIRKRGCRHSRHFASAFIRRIEPGPTKSSTERSVRGPTSNGLTLKGERLTALVTVTFPPLPARFNRVLVTVTDITERKRTEESLRQAQAELAHVTRVTTLGELTASIAHEINQPLAAIVADANASLNWLAAARPDLDVVRDALAAIVQEGHRAADVIQRIRQLASKTEPHKARLDVNHVICDVVPLVRTAVLSHRVSLRVDLASALAPVLGDRVQLQQVLINLVMNGIEAMASVGDRPPELVIRSRPHGGDQVLVAVQDAGVGIDPNTVDRLFSAFFTTKPGGLGMGLSISRSIIDAHGGRLWATPNPTHGATFHFALPVIQ